MPPGLGTEPPGFGACRTAWQRPGAWPSSAPSMLHGSARGRIRPPRPGALPWCPVAPGTLPVHSSCISASASLVGRWRWGGVTGVPLAGRALHQAGSAGPSSAWSVENYGLEQPRRTQGLWGAHSISACPRSPAQGSGGSQAPNDRRPLISWWLRAQGRARGGQEVASTAALGGREVGAPPD